MHEDFSVEEDFAFSEEDEELLRELKTGVSSEFRRDPVTGRLERQKNLLNKRDLPKHEMDEFFMDFWRKVRR